VFIRGKRGIDDELCRGLCPGERDDLGGFTHLRGALCESGAPYSIIAAPGSTGATVSAACFSVIMFFAPLIRAAFDIPDQTGTRRPTSIGRWCWNRAGTDRHHRPIDSKPAACLNRGGNWRPKYVVTAAAVQLSPVLYRREGTVDKVVQKIHALGPEVVAGSAASASWPAGSITTRWRATQ